MTAESYFVTIQEAADETGYSAVWLRRLARQWAEEDDHLPEAEKRARRSAGSWTIRLSSILDYAERHGPYPRSDDEG